MMKKIVSIILTAVLLFSSLCIGTVAASKTKIDSTLQQKIEQLKEDEKIEVIIWLNFNIDKKKVMSQTYQECGYIVGVNGPGLTLEQVYHFREVYNRIVKEMESAAAQDFVKKFGIPEEDIVYLSTHPYVIVNLTKDRIFEAITYAEVESVSDTAKITEEPTDDSPSGVTPAVSDDSLDLYKEKVMAYGYLYNYRELYYHTGEEGEIDWVLIRGDEGTSVFPDPIFEVIGNRVVVLPFTMNPFSTGYGIYDVKEDKLVTACDKTAALYDGLAEAYDQYGHGRLLGDIDNDDEISIVDATLIQRCQTGLGEYPESDTIDPEGKITESEFHPLRYYSDFNRDGERDIADATCIQRYVTGLSY